MSFGSPSAPTPPDPVATANAQSAMNADTARTNASLNRVNQFGPDGSITYKSEMPSGEWFDQRLAQDRQAVEAQGRTWNEGDARKYFEDQYKDKYSVTTQLSPQNQQLYNLSKEAQLGYGQAANNQIRAASGALSQPFDGQPYMGLQGGALAAGAGALSGAAGVAGQPFRDPGASSATDALYYGGEAARTAAGTAGRPINTDYNAIRQQSIDAANSRLQPQFREQEDQLRTRLLNTGITEGSEAWNRAYRQMNEGQNDSRQQTLLNAENQTGQAINQTGALRQIPLGELGQLQGIAQGYGTQASQALAQAAQARQVPLTEYGQVANLASNYGNQTSQGLSNALSVRSQPLNEAAALLTGQQVGVPQMQQVPGVNVAPTDYLGAVNTAYGGQVNAYNQQMGARNANIGALASIVSNVGRASMSGPAPTPSDRRLKTDIRRVGATDGGLPIYAYRYKAGGPATMGVMAQDVAKVNPDAVEHIGGGFLGVDYRQVA